MTSVAVLGDAMLDVVALAREPFAPGSDTASHVRLSRGGAAANLAVALRSAGHDVAYFAAVGDDVAGEFFRRDLEAHGVVAHLEVTGGATGTVVALVDAVGRRSMYTDRGANADLGPATAAALEASSFAHLHVSGYTVLDERSRALGVGALGAARARGATTSLDVCSSGPLGRVGAPLFRSLATGVTWLLANEDEALALAEVADLDVALEGLAPVADEVLVTAGARGAWLRRGEEIWHEPAREVEVRDTTGAGDAAGGAFLAARLAGLGVTTALERAMTAAAAVVQVVGSSAQSRA